MTIGSILKTAMKVAQQIPTAIALASCVIGIGEDVVRGASTPPEELEADAPALRRQVSEIMAALRRLREAVWPVAADFEDFEFDGFDYDVTPGNIVPFQGGPEPCT